jgi:hypothetical protein
MPPTTRDAITAALKECGPMSVPEIAEHLGLARNVINTCMTTTRKNHPGKFFRILRYERQRGRSGREIPIYSHAGGTDAPRPDLSSREHVRARQARYYQANRTLVLERFRARRGKPINPWGGLMPSERRTALPERTT